MLQPIRRPLHLLLFAATVLAAATGCNDGKSPQKPTPANMVPDFTLTDVNPNSTTSQQAVSPRHYLRQISAWYFGHST